jgi:hypothetical protein
MSGFPISDGTMLDAQVRCKDNTQLSFFSDEILPKIPGFQHIRFNIIHGINKDLFDWNIPE